jgi:hypothetical protein
MDSQAHRREITPVQRERHKHSPLAALSLLTAAARIDPTLREAVIAEMVKRLTGTDYDDWVENLCGDEFEWDEGTPP